MTNDALINGEVVTLTEHEVLQASTFHKHRVMFAWMPNGELVVHDDPNDDRDHQHWLLEEYDISPQQFESINRGYLLPYRVQLFIGSTFSPIDPSDIKLSDILKLVNMCADKYKSGSVAVFNGVKVGKVGEIWEPIEGLLTVVTEYGRQELRDEFKFNKVMTAVTKKRYAESINLKEGEIVSPNE